MTAQSRLVIDRLWDGVPAWPSERTEVAFSIGSSGLLVEVAANLHGDRPPALPPGRTDGLWDYEVVELFLANDDGQYLELEFGPHGHYLALRFSEPRQITSRDISISYQTEITGQCWRGRAQAPTSCLPAQLTRANAYAIHGQGQDRRYLAAFAVPGPRPDFHQPQFFQRW